MSIDTITPRSRRAVLFGALGGAAASIAAFVHPAVTRAGTDGDVVLDAVNTAAGTTEIDGSSSNPVIRVVGGTVAVKALSPSDVGVLGASGVAEVDIPAPVAQSTGVYGVSPAGHAVYGASDTGIGVYAASNASAAAAIVGTNSAGNGIRGHGQLDGVIGESAGGRSGVVGFSGGGSAPAGPGKTGVYGEATQDSASRGVYGFALAGQGVRGDASTGQGVNGTATTGLGVQGVATTGQGVRGEATAGGYGVHGQALGATGAHGVHGNSDTGQGVHGEATTGIGVQAVATTGVALAVSGRATFSRSGKVNVATGASSVDVTVAGGLTSSAIAFATVQFLHSGLYVVAARPNWPSAGKLRIYLSKAAIASTPVAWFVIG